MWGLVAAQAAWQIVLGPIKDHSTLLAKGYEEGLGDDRVGR